MSEVDPEMVGRALLAAGAADPGELLEVLRAEFATLPGALDIALHLIDYRLVTLRPVPTRARPRVAHPQPVENTPLGQAFRTQQPVEEPVPAGHLRHVPVSVRGQRLGVLSATLAQPPDPPARAVLNALALAAAHSLLELSPGTDLYETSRRHGRLSIAAEMQWQLLPARAFQTRRFYIAGHLEPALRVAGDAYDFAVTDDALTVTVLDASRTDGAPSWPTTLAITALRNARRSGLPLHEQAALANDIIWAQRGGRDHAAATLLHLDALAGRASIVHAGSPDLLRVRDGQVQPQPLDSQTPLGMFEGSEYTEQSLDLRPGDRVYLLTDGALAHDHTLTDLLELLGTTDHGLDQAPPESVRRLVATLLHDRDEPDDDITIVCLDWLH